MPTDRRRLTCRTVIELYSNRIGQRCWKDGFVGAGVDECLNRLSSPRADDVDRYLRTMYHTTGHGGRRIDFVRRSSEISSDAAQKTHVSSRRLRQNRLRFARGFGGAAGIVQSSSARDDRGSSAVPCDPLTGEFPRDDGRGAVFSCHGRSPLHCNYSRLDRAKSATFFPQDRPEGHPLIVHVRPVRRRRSRISTENISRVPHEHKLKSRARSDGLVA